MSDMSKHDPSNADIMTLLLRLTAKVDALDGKVDRLDAKVNIMAVNLSSLHTQLLQHVNDPGAHHPY